MGIRAIERTGTEFIHDFQARYHLTPFGEYFLYQVPLGAVVDKRRILAYIPERRHETVPAVPKALHKRLRTDVVVPDGELVGPALKGVSHIAVNHHVFREVSKVHPFIGGAFEGLFDIAVQHRHAFFHLFAELTGNPVDMSPADAGEKRGGKRKESRRHESDRNPVPYDSSSIHGDRALP